MAIDLAGDETIEGSLFPGHVEAYARWVWEESETAESVKEAAAGSTSLAGSGHTRGDPKAPGLSVLTWSLKC